MNAISNESAGTITTDVGYNLRSRANGVANGKQNGVSNGVVGNGDMNGNVKHEHSVTSNSKSTQPLSEQKATPNVHVSTDTMPGRLSVDWRSVNLNLLVYILVL